MSDVMTPEQAEYLQSHRLAVLATGRSDGSPQVSTIMYQFDGETVVISAKTYTAKWQNAVRQQNVAMVINDDRVQMVLYGTAEGIADDPERMTQHKRILGVFSPELPTDEEIIERLDREKRTIIRITPTKVLFNE
jgi:PPOX class probable F420-dependent enzyme